MATKDDIAQLKKSIQELRRGQLEILLKLEDLQEKFEGGGGGGGKKPAEPEPILTCVHCSAEYEESKNAVGSCYYHSGTLRGVGWDFKYTCCGKSSKNFESAKLIAGCTKGKHRSVHHTEFTYANYIFYMQDQSKKATEVWMEMDIEDNVTDRCMWAEVSDKIRVQSTVGKNDSGNVFILVGTSRIEYNAIATFSSEELKALTEDKVALDINNEIGWKIKAEVLAAEKQIKVALLPASEQKPLVKQVGYSFNENGDLVAGIVKTISTPNDGKKGEEKKYIVPEDLYEGPKLVIGEDCSKNRKNDYETETVGNCPLKLQQAGATEVLSTQQRIEGKWKNMFSCKTKVTNAGKENISVTEVKGYYKNHDGEWVQVNEVLVGKEFFRGNYEWFDTSNFWLNAGTTGSLLVRLVIEIEGTPPESNYEGRRCDSSLPQPLYLKFTFTDQQGDSASLQFEQGNPPLDLATRETRINGWSGKCAEDMLFWSFADDTTSNKRSDVAIYKDSNGQICYRPAPLGNGGQYFFIEHSLKKFGYKGKSNGQEEVEISDWKKESKGSSITPYALVDVETGTAYGLKVLIVTPTSKTTSFFLCPQPPPPGSNILTVKNSKIGIKGDVNVSWRVYRCSKSDQIYIYPVNGKSYVSSSLSNKNKSLESEGKLKGPDKPGEYEVRYYPAWLRGSTTGYRHDIYIASARFTVAV